MKPQLGLFDSGVGGLTVLRRVIERHGQRPCLYLGDTARVPYGSRSSAEIRLIAEEVIHWLRSQGVSVVVMACNTTNALARDVVEKVAEMPVVGLIETAAEMLSESRIGVLATPATAASGAYRAQIQARRAGVFVLEQSCPDLVPLIEAGELHSEKLLSAARDYVAPLIEARVEAVVLGCTHYPLLTPLLQGLLPEDMRLVDPARGVAVQLDQLIGAPDLSLQLVRSQGSTRFCVTADPIGFAARAMPWLSERPKVELVSLPRPACAS